MSWAVWLTGPPAAGKTTLARLFHALLKGEGIRAVSLESDALRRILTPEPSYAPEERDRFYQVVADLAALLVAQGFPVVVDATAPRRAHRDRARGTIARFLEVYVQTPLEICQARDPKGLYRLAREGRAPYLPGTSETYEEPTNPDLVVSGTAGPEEGAGALLRLARTRSFL
jgi:adenylylsulfate kinase